MKEDELNKLIDNSLDRLSKKKEKQNYEAEKKSLKLPSLKTVKRTFIFASLVLALTWWLYYLDIKEPLFTLGFWSYPLFIAYMTVSITINNDRNVDIEIFFNLMAIYATASIVGFYFYKKFIVFILSAGYQITIPFFNYTLELI